MLCHLSALLGWLGNGLLWVAGPLILWLVKRNDHPFIDDQGKESVNFHLSLLIYALGIVVVGVPTLIIGIGLVILIVGGIALAIIQPVFSIIAAIQASNGMPYRYPMTIRFLK